MSDRAIYHTRIVLDCYSSVVCKLIHSSNEYVCAVMMYNGVVGLFSFLVNYKYCYRPLLVMLLSVVVNVTGATGDGTETFGRNNGRKQSQDTGGSAKIGRDCSGQGNACCVFEWSYTINLWKNALYLT